MHFHRDIFKAIYNRAQVKVIDISDRKWSHLVGGKQKYWHHLFVGHSIEKRFVIFRKTIHSIIAKMVKRNIKIAISFCVSISSSKLSTGWPNDSQQQ